VLVLATLGDTTQIGLFLFFVAALKVAKASTSVSLTDLYIGLQCRCHQHYQANFANVKTNLVLGANPLSEAPLE